MAGETNAVTNGAAITPSEDLASAFDTDLSNASSQQEAQFTDFLVFGGFSSTDVGEQLPSTPDDVFGETASPEDELLDALDERAAQRSSPERDAYRRENGFDPSEGAKGMSWDQFAEGYYERNGQIGLVREAPGDFPATAPSGTDGMTMQQATDALGEVLDRYQEESADASPSLDRQQQYIDEQLRILNDYRNNPGDTPTESDKIDIEMAIGQLQAQRDLISGEVAPPLPEAPEGDVSGGEAPDTPNVLPDPIEGPIDPQREGQAPVTPTPASGGEGPDEAPEEGDPAPDTPDTPTLVVTPDPSKDPQPTGDGIEDIFGGGAVRPETVTPLPDGIEIPSNVTFPTAITGGGQAVVGTTTPVEGGIAILDVTDFDPRSLADGLVVNTTTTTPVDNVVVGNFGGLGGTPLGGGEGPDPRAEDLDTLLESFDFSSVNLG